MNKLKRYRCSICGYIYDEAVEGVKFEDLPSDWKCPLCGAPKALFEEVKEENKKEENNTIQTEELNKTEQETEDLIELSNYEISLICSNLARGCKMQYLEEEQELFSKLAKYYEEKEEVTEGILTDISQKVENDIQNLDKAINIADKYEDRGAKRIITWATKSTNMMKAILANIEKNGIEQLKNTKIWVCDICGFVYIGDVPPEVCPICKVPNLKILEVK